MTLVGRRQLNHPALSTAGGSGLHASIESIYTLLSDDMPGRWFANTAVANSTATVLVHNFGGAFDQYTVLLYTGTSADDLTRVTDPAGSGWTIVATPSFLKTKITVTTPSSGGPHNFFVFILHSGASLGSTATSTALGLVTSFTPLAVLGVASKAAAYVVLDNDGYHTILMTTSTTDKTVTLPTAADNAGRSIRFKKIDNGAGKLIIDGEGSESIDGALTYECIDQYSFVALVCDGTSWHIVA